MRNRLSLEEQAEVVFRVARGGAKRNAVAAVYGISHTAVTQWVRAVTTGVCYDDGGIGVDGTKRLQDAYTQLVLRRGLKPEQLPEPHFVRRHLTRMAPQMQLEMRSGDHQSGSEEPTRQPMREILSTRRANALGEAIEALNKRVTFLERELGIKPQEAASCGR